MRFTTGDAMSKRSKFALITWIGENVSGLQRAKTGTDKTLVKEVVQVIGFVLFLRLGGSRPTQGRRPQGQSRPGLAPVTESKLGHISVPPEPPAKCHRSCMQGAGSGLDHHVVETWRLGAHL